MTIASNVSKSPVYTGTGLVSNYAYPFKIPTAEELLVRMSDTDGLERSLILTNEYSVTGVGASNGGDVVLAEPLPAGYKLVILRNMDFIQETDLENQGGFYPEVIEDAFDRLTMQNQQLKEVVDRLSSPNATETTPPGAGSYLAAMEDVLADATVLMDGKVSDAEDAQVAAEAAAVAAIAAKNDVISNTPHGFNISIGTDTEHDITISAGSIPDSTFTYNMSLAAPITKQIDAVWAEGDNVGGMPTDSFLAPNAWHGVWAIYNPTTLVTDVCFIREGEFPAGFTAHRLLGLVLTDSSSNLIPFVFYVNNHYWEWTTPILDQSFAPANTSAALKAISTPVGIYAKAKMNVSASSDGAAYCFVYIRNPATTDQTPIENAAPLYSLYGYGPATMQQMECLTDTSSRVSVRTQRATTAKSTSIKICTLGYTWNRGW